MFLNSLIKIVPSNCTTYNYAKILTLCMLGNLSCHICHLLISFKISVVFEKFFQEYMYHQSIKHFGSRSGPTKLFTRSSADNVHYSRQGVNYKCTLSHDHEKTSQLMRFGWLLPTAVLTRVKGACTPTMYGTSESLNNIFSHL